MGRENPSHQVKLAERLAQGIERLLDALLAIMLLIMVAAIFYQIFGRYVLDRAPSWGEELARYMMVYITMLGSAVETRSGGHLTVTTIADKLGPKGLRILLAVRDVAVVATCGLLINAGIDLVTIMHRQSSPAFEIPMSIPYAAQPVGFALILILVVVARLAGRPARVTAGEAI
jgi:TRAP-type C4-dicarboxylate transport system permease small subunit